MDLLFVGQGTETSKHSAGKVNSLILNKNILGNEPKMFHMCYKNVLHMVKIC